MLQAIVSEMAKQWFTEYYRLAYWLGRRWSQRLLDRQARQYSADELAELSQDAVCRGFDRFVKRCSKEIPGVTSRKRWVCQCVIRGARDAVRAKSRFGSITDPVSVRDDAMNRYNRVSPGFVHGADDERQDAMEAVAYRPVVHAVQRWELEELIEKELPSHLQQTALYAVCGLTQDQSAILQGVTDRTVRNRLSEIKEYLAPDWNIYGIICAALRVSLADDFHRPKRRFPVSLGTFDE